MADVPQKTKRSRPDRVEHTEDGDNRRYLNHSLAMWDWDAVDMKVPEQVEERIVKYFSLCAADDMKPSVAGLAVAFGVDRKTIWAWVNGVDSAYVPLASRNAIKKAHQLLNLQMENYMQNGKINPVAGIFLMKNNMGYRDQQEVVVTPNTSGDYADPTTIAEKYKELPTLEADDFEVK